MVFGQQLNTQATDKGYDQTARSAQADLRLCWSHIPHCWKSHVKAHLEYRCRTGPIFRYLSLVRLHSSLAWLDGGNLVRAFTRLYTLYIYE